MPSFQTVEKVSFQQDIALNQLPKAHKSAATPVAATLQYLAENGVKSAKNFIAAPPGRHGGTGDGDIINMKFFAK